MVLLIVNSIFACFKFALSEFKVAANGHLQVVVADFEERQCPTV